MTDTYKIICLLEKILNKLEKVEKELKKQNSMQHNMISLTAGEQSDEVDKTR